jgi:hypothetical protein
MSLRFYIYDDVRNITKEINIIKNMRITRIHVEDLKWRAGGKNAE